MTLAAPPYKMWAIEIIVVVLGLLVMAQPSMQLSLRNPVQEIVQKLNGAETSPIGVVSLTSGSECALDQSGVFTVTSTANIAGKIFRIGKINGTDVVYARSGELMVNVGSTVQVLVDKFNVKGIVHFGGAASIDDSVRIGYVSVPYQVAYTAAWSWRNSSNDTVQDFLKDYVYGNFSFEDFNVPKTGINLLGRIYYWASTWFTGQQKQNKGFWLSVDKTWLEIASQIQGLKLKRCINITTCLHYEPKVEFGLKAGTGDLFIVNQAYGKFLHNYFNISTLDTSDSAIAMTCFSNDIPYIVFRGVSNEVTDNDPKTTFAPLGNANAVRATAAFLGLLNSENAVANA